MDIQKAVEKISGVGVSIAAKIIENGLEDEDIVALRDPNKENLTEEGTKDNSVQMPENGN